MTVLKLPLLNTGVRQIRVNKDADRYKLNVRCWLKADTLDKIAATSEKQIQLSTQKKSTSSNWSTEH